jgi:tetratricopeptide (TPR) repeat protein
MENRLSPIREMFGELLLEANEPARALNEFETSLRNNPNRYRSFAGAKAAERVGNRAQARSYYQKLVSLAAQADDGRPGLVAAKQYLILAIRAAPPTLFAAGQSPALGP